MPVQTPDILTQGVFKKVDLSELFYSSGIDRYTAQSLLGTDSTSKLTIEELEVLGRLFTVYKSYNGTGKDVLKADIRTYKSMARKFECDTSSYQGICKFVKILHTLTDNLQRCGVYEYFAQTVNQIENLMILSINEG